MLPLRGPVAEQISSSLSGSGGVLVLVHVDERVREVTESTGVIQVEVCEHDVANVLGRVAEVPDLAYRSLRGIKCRTNQRDPVRAESSLRFANIRRADAGLDQDQA